MKKVLSVVLAFLMVLSSYNLFLSAKATAVYGTSAAGIVPTAFTNNDNINAVNDPAHPEFFQYKWESPTSQQNGSVNVTVTVPGTSQTVTATLNFKTADNKTVTWWISNQSSGNGGYQLIMKWVGVKGANGYNLYTYPSDFSFKVTAGSVSFTGDSDLRSPEKNSKTPDLSHVVFNLTFGTATVSSTSSESSSSSTSSESSSSSTSSESSSSSTSSESSSSSTSSESSSSSTSSESSSSSTSSESSSSVTSISESSVPLTSGSSSETTISDSSVPLTNGSSSETTISDPSIPKTSEAGSSNVLLYALILLSSGTVLVLLNRRRNTVKR